jgi:hypothetical protein
LFIPYFFQVQPKKPFTYRVFVVLAAPVMIRLKPFFNPYRMPRFLHVLLFQKIADNIVAFRTSGGTGNYSRFHRAVIWSLPVIFLISGSESRRRCEGWAKVKKAARSGRNKSGAALLRAFLKPCPACLLF